MTTPAPAPPQVRVSVPEFHGISIEEWSQFVGALRVELLRNPSVYPTDAPKVTMALSYFRSGALEWLNVQSDVTLQSWMGSWTVFMSALANQFGAGDDQLKVIARQRLDALSYDRLDPTPFFADATTHLTMMGVQADTSRILAVWDRVPQGVKELLIARNQVDPTWQQLRRAASAYAAVQPAPKGRKPKCTTCGKRHSGICRSKN